MRRGWGGGGAVGGNVGLVPQHNIAVISIKSLKSAHVDLVDDSFIKAVNCECFLDV